MDEEQPIVQLDGLELFPTPPPTPDIIKKMTRLLLIDAYRRRVVRIRWEVAGDKICVFYHIDGEDLEVMRPPVVHLEYMLEYLRELCEVDEAATEGSGRFRTAVNEALASTLFKVRFLDTTTKEDGTVICEIDVEYQKPG